MRLFVLAVAVLSGCAETDTTRPGDDAARGDPLAVGDNNGGDSARGDPRAGDDAVGDSANGDSARGDPRTGDDAVGDAGVDPYQGRPIGQCTEDADCRPNGIGTLTCQREAPGGICGVCADDNCPDMNLCVFGACVSQCGGDDDCPPGRYCGGTSRCLIQACVGGLCPTPLFGCSSAATPRCVRVSCAGGELCPPQTTCTDGLCIEDRAL